jgi:multimeric flavodoxin WrbA
MTKLLAVNGSYRENGVMDQAVELAAQTITEAGATIEVIHLRDFPIEFCRNCRHCTQVPGESPGECVQQDGMRELIQKIEAADGYILASPTNFYSVTALFKRFMERLVVYTYWPWGTRAPKSRTKIATKKAILIASSAAPGFMGRMLYATVDQLKLTAKTIGAKPIGSVFVGSMSLQEHPELPDKVQEQVRTMARELM